MQPGHLIRQPFGLPPSRGRSIVVFGTAVPNPRLASLHRGELSVIRTTEGEYPSDLLRRPPPLCGGEENVRAAIESSSTQGEGRRRMLSAHPSPSHVKRAGGPSDLRRSSLQPQTQASTSDRVKRGQSTGAERSPARRRPPVVLTPLTPARRRPPDRAWPRGLRKGCCGCCPPPPECRRGRCAG